ncbi:MAG TPA: LD-carboxypeptidase, partial [bacterium]|nr:LD-carboxypeptidase [bacterium]
MRPIKPFGLVPGDRIGIVAPASSFESRGLKRGINKLKWWGFDVVVPRPVFKHAKRPKDRDRRRRYKEKAELLIKMIKDPSIAAIFCAEGGYGSIALVPYLEEVDLSYHPKIFVGFSDITILLIYFFQKYRWVTFHGPTVAQELYKGMPPTTEIAIQESITKKTRLGDLYGKPLEVIKSGEASGLLVGGNLSRMISTLGTSFEIDTDDRLFFIEEYDEGHMKIDGDLNHLKLAGKFDRVKGIIFSEMNRCMHGRKNEVKKYLRRYFRDMEIPILFGLPSGHGVENIT